ncbi:peroxiredoxin [Rhodovulum sulfidophilum]|uniref:peroxiredoxin n=1 Tax=Rhodovulum sulfidophilum TaxID=35806 RepID=UPI001F23E475|nr:peroxiredoxin [Rhodovulum sulfidophilum]MCE8418987.1 peroxiredoxin [Rhodovulum sulfidophilum]MCE8440575.1 peroxiredoxin [Rhodovulum sulfidophilum]MCE8467565.1 peroxiredoxin [Rhodovulum sulfidophilum]
MSLRINDIAPNFTAETTDGPIDFHDWIGDSYAVLFSHPKDFTPVCTTEFAAAARLSGEFAKRNAKVIGLSVDPVEEHLKWKADIETHAGCDASFPIIADDGLKVAKLYDMLPAEAYLPDGRTANDSATVRTTFIINPDKKIELMLIYPMTVGRNFDEILRVLDAIRANKTGPFATPANWRPGEDVIVGLSVSTEEARAQFGEVEEIFPYLRKVKQAG